MIFYKGCGSLWRDAMGCVFFMRELLGGVCVICAEVVQVLQGVCGAWVAVRWIFLEQGV